MSDCVVSMLDELRRQRPPVFDADAFGSWEAAIGQVIASLPGRDQRWGATVLVAQDLCDAMPGMPLPVAFLRVQTAIYSAPVEDV
jgi:hypothetical protein